MEVGNAEKLLLAEDKGVVDELGLLTIHQAVADRLFPGTSVLHTRLRYALFVPWLMQRAAGERDSTAALRALEFKLTGELIRGTVNDREGRKGIIGARVYRYNKPAAQPPSFSYWTALSVWGILGRGHAQALTSREGVMAALAEGAVVTDEAGHTVADGATLLEGLPCAPEDLFNSSDGLTFELFGEEAEFLKRRLTAVKRPDSPCESLLAALARKGIRLDEEIPPWSSEVQECASADDRKVLTLASHASFLGGIVRAVYLALVERACERQGLAVHSNHVEQLKSAVRDWGEKAMQLDLDAMRALGLGLNSGRLFQLLTYTKQWLEKRPSFTSLEEVYREVETKKKTDRARLAGTSGAAAHLRQWAQLSAKSRPAAPLHFRWPQVVRLLNDLHGH